MMLSLYYAQHTCSLASHIALEEAGASYELKRLDIDKKEHHRRDYLAINAKARVPAMLAFIAQTYPAAKLAPIDDPFALGEVQAFNSYLYSTVHVAHAHRMRGHR
jgi:glutathione S-transferase